MPIDWETIALVWDEHGYPADPVYRDYHAQTRERHARVGERRRARTTTTRPRARAREHARDFVEQRDRARLDAYRAARGRPALVVCALDTELLGHWWYEGPQWLEAVIDAGRRARASRSTTLPAALERHDPVERPLVESIWGTERTCAPGTRRAVAELVWPARRGRAATSSAALGCAERSTLADRAAAARRAARELLALQSSDWSFMATRGLAGDYPAMRVRDHAAALRRGDRRAAAAP